MSKYEDQFDDNNVICPYCGYSYQQEAENYSEDSSVEECGECGKKYYQHESFSVTHYAIPDCELNGEEHDWQPQSLGGGRYHDFCETCGKCRPVR